MLMDYDILLKYLIIDRDMKHGKLLGGKKTNSGEMRL
jgi:hypothetical protein